jgi:cystinosin
MQDLWSRFVESNFFKDNYQLDKMLIPISLTLGISVGLVVQGAEDLSPGAQRISSVMGWTYFFCWAISFWPQVVTNYYNETTHGLATDKYIYDLVGFAALSIYECSMFFDKSTRRDYAEQHHGELPEVEINDVWFALHSLMLTFIVIYQILIYDGFSNPPKRINQWISGLLTIAAIIFFIAYNFWSTVVPLFSWLNWLYVLSTVKVIITCLKFLPQVMLNYERKATRGWNIYGTFLDLSGKEVNDPQ